MSYENNSRYNVDSIQHYQQPTGGRSLSRYEELLQFDRRNLAGKRVLDLGTGPRALFAKELRA